MTRGERIKQRREELGITQEELAKRLGYKGKSAISRIESAGNNISYKIAEKVAPALDTTPAELFGIVDVVYDSRKDGEYQIILEYRKHKYTEEMLKRLLSYMRFLSQENSE